MRLRSTKVSSTGYNIGGSISYGDPDALAYISALTATGITVSESRNNAITTFIGIEKASGRWNIHKRIYLPIWQSAAANAICMKSLTTGTFSGSITHEVRGVKVTNTNGNMNTNTSLGALGITKNSFHFAMILPEGPEENYSIPFSVNNFSVPGNSIFPLWNDGYSYTKVMEHTFGDPIFTNFPSVVSLGSDSVAGNLYLKEHIVGSTSSQIITGSVATTFPSTNLFILGQSDGSAGMNSPIGAFSVSTELSSAEDASYSTSLRTLWYSCVIGSDNPANAVEPNATAWVLMDGPWYNIQGDPNSGFIGGQSWRKMAPIGYAPYGNETYVYGDETIRYETGVWLYLNSGLGEIARAYSYEPYPWLATTWNNGFTAAKITSTYVKTTNYPAVP